MWKIIDDNGQLYSGDQHEIMLIWDLLTRDIPDLASEYRRTYSEQELIDKKAEYFGIEFSGELHLIEIHKTLTQDEYTRRKTQV